eukprot:472952_1
MSQDVLPTQALFSDQTGADVGAMFAILLGAMIAAGGGLGGGGIFVPIYILILGYPPKFAAALSQATIFGGSIVNLIMNLKKFHPTRTHRPLTDFPTLLIFEPMLLVGTIIGVLFNVMFPDILILILLAAVLSYATVRTTRKGIRLWKKETNEFKNEAKTDQTDTKKVSIEMKDIKAKSNSDQTEIEVDTTEKPDEPQTEKDDQPDTQTDINGNNTQNEDNPSPDTNEDKQSDTDENKQMIQHIDPQAKEDDAQTDTKEDDAQTQAENVDKQSDTDEDKRPSQVPFKDAPLDDKTQSQATATLEATDDINQLAKGCGVDPAAITDDKVELCKEFIERESQVLKPSVAILVVWFCVSFFNMVKKAMPDCSAGYWLMTFVPFPIMMGVSWYMTKREYEYYQIKLNSLVWVPAFGDIKLEGDFVKILKFPAIASIAGILGGLLGIGGGMIVSPLLIELGVIPTVAASTSAMAVLITSSSAMLQFLLLGFLQWDYTLFFMIIGIIGTYVGQTAVNHAVKEYGRVSVVIFAVATVMGLAIVLMMVNGAMSLVDGVSWAFATPC